jgi:hypothetical protein
MADRNLVDLKELIELAETSASTIESYNNRLDKIRYFPLIVSAVLLFAFSVLFMTLTLNNPYFFKGINSLHIPALIAGAMTGVSISIAWIPIFRSRNRLLHEKEKENYVLRKLLSMIHELKEYTFQLSTITSVEKALIEIRLSRISFLESNT